MRFGSSSRTAKRTATTAPAFTAATEVPRTRTGAEQIQQKGESSTSVAAVGEKHRTYRLRAAASKASAAARAHTHPTLRLDHTCFQVQPLREYLFTCVAACTFSLSNGNTRHSASLQRLQIFHRTWWGSYDLQPQRYRLVVLFSN